MTVNATVEGGRSFRVRMELVAADLERRINNRARNYALELHAQLIKTTPILTGQARSNWRVDLNDRDDDFITPRGYTTNSRLMARWPKDRMSWSTYGTVQEASLANYRSGDVIFIHNNLPYIGRLNDGYSRQAPAQFVELAIARVRAIYGAAGLI